MKIVLLLFALAFAATGQTKPSGATGSLVTSAMETNRVTFTNLQGRLFSNVMVSISDPASINVLWNRATVPTRIDFTNLPKEVQQKFHYDPDAADDFRLRDAAMKEGEKAERDHSNSVRQLAIKSERRDLGQVVQITTNGLLARIFHSRGEPGFPRCDNMLVLSELRGLGSTSLKRIEVRGVPIEQALYRYDG